MKHIRQAAYVLFFFSLVTGTFWLFWWLNPLTFLFYFGCLALMVSKKLFNNQSSISEYGYQVIASIDRHWQVVLAPLLNLGVSSEYRFGVPSQTASYVIGRNLINTDEWQWKVIEFVLSITLEQGKPHARHCAERNENRYK